MEGVAGVLVGDIGGCGLESWRDGRGVGLGFIWSRALGVGRGGRTIGCVTDVVVVVVTVAEPGTVIGWEGGMVGCWWGLGLVVETKWCASQAGFDCEDRACWGLLRIFGSVDT